MAAPMNPPPQTEGALPPPSRGPATGAADMMPPPPRATGATFSPSEAVAGDGRKPYKKGRKKKKKKDSANVTRQLEGLEIDLYSGLKNGGTEIGQDGRRKKRKKRKNRTTNIEGSDMPFVSPAPSRGVPPLPASGRGPPPPPRR